MFDRADAIDSAFTKTVKSGEFPPRPQRSEVHNSSITNTMLVDLFDSQIMSRHLDLMARRSKGKTFYSIGSAGHEGMAVVGAISRPTDMAFLHYRDAGLLIQRLKHCPGETPLHQMALSFTASAEDPVSGGRHKVLGSATAYVPPQTSTIASHLPKAVGAAHSIALANKLKTVDTILPRDSIILASFGDASANHSTAQGAFNTAAWAAWQGAPMPIVFLCEDNDIGISVPTPAGWIAANFANRPGLTYFTCDGTDLIDCWAGVEKAVRFTRLSRKPAFLHIKTVRLMGHAGADIEASYKSLTEIEATERRDPLLRTAEILRERQILGTDEILDRYETMRARVERVANRAMATPKLTSAKQVMHSLVPPAKNTPNNKMNGLKLKPPSKPAPLGRHINHALAEILADAPNALIFGEDVGRKGGVYGITNGLQSQYGRGRVLDTLLDEQSILGLAIGSAHNGFIPIPEIQFLAYLHNAEDQVRGEAATLSFFSNGQYTNPMVIRIAGLAYQRGFGGHFHNDNAIGVLRDIPGIIVACPSRGADARAMLHECFRLARDEQRVVIFLEPIALYNQTDLYAEGDGAWAEMILDPDKQSDINYGDVGISGRGTDLAIVTYGNGNYLSHKAMKTLRDEHGIKTRIIDLRWLHPLPEKALIKAIKSCRHILIVDECRQTGSPSEGLMTLFQERKLSVPIKRLTAEDSFIPLGPAAYSVLPSVEAITKAALTVCGKMRGGKQP